MEEKTKLMMCPQAGNFKICCCGEHQKTPHEHLDDCHRKCGYAFEFGLEGVICKPYVPYTDIIKEAKKNGVQA